MKQISTALLMVLLIGFSSFIAYGQGNNKTNSVEVKGSVYDDAGQPLAGATVIIKGTSIGTQADNDGKFTINLPNDKVPILMISHISMISKEINVKDKTYIKVTMEKSEGGQGEEVVVIGYGAQKKKDVVTSVSTIKAAEIAQENAINVGNALQGKVNGSIIVSSNGTPGRDRPTIMIRNSNPNYYPLIVIDGVPSNGDKGNPGNGSGIIMRGLTLDEINPDDIESISVLKDNAATAVYGVKGGNGVILITTKRGKIGKPQFSLTANHAISKPSRMPKLLDSYHWALANNEANINDGYTAGYNDSVLSVIKYGLDPFTSGRANTDWYDVLNQRTATQTMASLGVSGGSDAIRYYINGSVSNQKSMIKAFDYTRFTIQSNLDIKLHRDLKLAANINYVNSNLNGAQALSGSGVFSNILTKPPTLPVFNKDGSIYATSLNTNPWANTLPELSGYQKNISNNISVQANLQWSPSFAKGLTFRLNNSVSFQAAQYKIYQRYYDGFQPNYNGIGYMQKSGTGIFTNTSDNTIYTNNVEQTMGNTIAYNTDYGFDYTRAFGKHKVALTALGTHYYSSYTILGAKRYGLLGNLELLTSGTTNNQTITGSESLEGRVGGILRFNYDFNSKYYLEYSMRADGSVRYAPKYKWGYFPGGAISWRISQENFIKNNDKLKFINDLKIRVSAGLTGNDNLEAASYYYNYSVATAGPGGGYGGYILGGVYQPGLAMANKTIPNPEVTWGKSLMRTIGLDFSLWKGLLSGTFDIYDKMGYDLAYSNARTMPAYVGLSAPLLNTSKEYSHGFEISLTNNLKLGKEMSLQTSFNLSYITSRVIDYFEPINTPTYDIKQGHSFQRQGFYKALGIFQSQDEINKWPTVQDAAGNTKLKPGDIKFADMNGDGTLDDNDKVIYDNLNTPPISAGLNLTFQYKSFSVNAFFQGAGGNWVQFVPGTATFGAITEYGYENSWRPSNPNAKYPRMSGGATGNNFNSVSTRPSTLYLVKGDYIRFKNLKFAYNIPAELLKRTGLSNASISIAALNLTAISALKDIDPESQGSNLSAGGYYPVMRNFSVGLNLGF